MLMPQKVLIVDDSIQLHKLIKGIWPIRLCSSIPAFDGATAVTLAADLQPDLVWLDVDIAKAAGTMDGFEVCRRLKADPGTVDKFRSFSDRRLLDRSAGMRLRAGARWITFTKPFDPRE